MYNDSSKHTAVSRRTLLQGLAAAGAAAAVPFSLLAAEQEGESKSAKDPALDNSAITTQLAAYMAAAGTMELPDDAQEKTKHHVLDTIAAMVSGANLPPAKVARRFAE